MKKAIPSPNNDSLSVLILKEKWVVKSVTCYAADLRLGQIHDRIKEKTIHVNDCTLPVLWRRPIGEPAVSKKLGRSSQ